MSIKLMTLIFDVDGWLSASEKLMMLALADHANDEGKHIYPGTSRLMKKCGLGETAVRSTLKKLEKIGLLITVRAATPTSTAERNIVVDRLKFMVENPIIATTVSGNDTGESQNHCDGVSGDDTGVSGDDTGGTGERTGEVREPIPGVSAGGPESSDNHQQPSENVSEPLAANGAKSDPHLPVEMAMTPAAAWESARVQLRGEMRLGDYNHWVGPLQMVSFSDGVFRLGAPDEQRKGWVESRLGKQISRLLAVNLGRPVQMEVSIVQQTL